MITCIVAHGARTVDEVRAINKSFLAKFHATRITIFPKCLPDAMWW